MGNLVVSNDGEKYLLDTTLRTPLATPEVWHVHGFTNDYTPLGNITLADLDEITLTGYSPAPIDRALWPASSSIGGQAVAVYGGNPVQLTCTFGVSNVFGFYVTDESDAVLLWAERFDDAPRVLDPLHPILVLLSLAGRSQSEPT